jgi:hypothetical protein
LIGAVKYGFALQLRIIDLILSCLQKEKGKKRETQKEIQPIGTIVFVMTANAGARYWKAIGVCSARCCSLGGFSMRVRGSDREWSSPMR